MICSWVCSPFYITTGSLLFFPSPQRARSTPPLTSPFCLFFRFLPLGENPMAGAPPPPESPLFPLHALSLLDPNSSPRFFPPRIVPRCRLDYPGFRPPPQLFSPFPELPSPPPRLFQHLPPRTAPLPRKSPLFFTTPRLFPLLLNVPPFPWIPPPPYYIGILSKSHSSSG